ncbi:unnamed protein product, partial [Pylaiella littoralis]
RGESDVPGGVGCFLFSHATPGGVYPGGLCKEWWSAHTHTQQLPTVMDKVYEQAYKRQKGPEKNKSTECEEKEESKEGSSWGSLPRPSASAKKRKGPAPREYPPAPFTLRRISGKRGRNSYENIQKLEVLIYSRLMCSDGQPVGRRGAGKVFGIGSTLCFEI